MTLEGAADQTGELTVRRRDAVLRRALPRSSTISGPMIRRAVASICAEPALIFRHPVVCSGCRSLFCTDPSVSYLDGWPP